MRVLWLGVGISALAGCASTGGPAGRWQLEDLIAGAHVELDGVLGEDGIVVARKVTFENPGPYSEIKGTISEIDLEALRVVVPPFTLQFSPETDIDDNEDVGDSYRFDELQVGWRIEVEIDRLPDGTLIAIGVAVDRVPDADKIGLVEIETSIETVEGEPDDDERILVLLGTRCAVDIETPIESQTTSGRRQARRVVSKDDDRGDSEFRFDLGSTQLFAGGVLQSDWERRENFELDETVHRDIATTEAQITLELDWVIGTDVYAFLKVSSQRAEVIYDEDRDLELGEDTRVTEAYGYWQYILDYPIAVQVGRQRFEDAREWYYDAEIDGARILWFSGPFELEYSYSAFLNDNKTTSFLTEDIRNQFFSASYVFEKKSRITFHVIDIVDSLTRQGNSLVEFSPFYLGVSAIGRWKGEEYAARYWGQYSYVDGVIGTQKLAGHAIDLGGAWHWQNAPLAPYLFAGYAWGSGDSSPGGSTSGEYRQSGYQDNNDKLFGVASYRYYGELFRPELANLHVWTGGVGIRPVQWLSVDLALHQYFQDVASVDLRESRLRSAPDGNDPDLGQEIDLVLGINKLWKHWDLELDLGYFVPGNAFETTDDPASWLAFQLEFNF